MSRAIQTKTSLTISDAERALQKSDDGKLLISRYRDRSCALLLQNDRLTAVAFPEESKVGAVYIAKVRNVVKNIEACFVEIAEGEICFLPLKEAVCPLLLNRKFDGKILVGDELPVQIIRDAQKTKQASVTAHISLSDDYFAFAFGTERIGFSAKLLKEQKQLLAHIFSENSIMKDGRLSQGIFSVRTAFEMPSIGLIVRTKAGELLDNTDDTWAEKTILHLKEFADEFNLFLRDAIHHTCFSCLKEAENIISGTMSSLIAPYEYSEILTDDEAYYQQLKEYAEKHFPDKTVRLYSDELISMNKLYQIDSKLETVLRERVWLKSGGYLIIQPTEALTVIDVNSGKYEASRKAGEEYTLKVNREAAEEIAIQLRARNLSGIIIADFINMETEEYKQELISYLRSLVKKDKVRTTVVDMTPLGLVEITRKKITKPLYEQLKEKE